LSPYSILVPFVLIVGTNVVQNAFEDLQRYKGDRELNQRIYLVQKNGAFKEKLNKKLQVGDLLYLKEDQEVPADCLLLATSDIEDGICFVETANLDGESNLKQVQSLKATYKQDEKTLCGFKAYIRAEPPNSILDQFKGNIIFPDSSGNLTVKPVTDPSVIPLDNKAILLRGVTIRNTKFAYAVIVYAGKRTKLALNQLAPSFKLSITEKVLNWFTFMVFVLVALIQVVFTVVSTCLERRDNPGMWYNPVNPTPGYSVDAVYVSFGYFVMLSYFIPISAFVNFEISKLSNAGFMITDNEMRSKKGLPMKVKSTHLADEMSRIHYVFSDKTGTLTQNKMVFQKCVVGTRVYDDAGSGSLKNVDHPEATNFMLAMALNHQVLPELRPGSDIPHFGAPTPDEIALVKGAWKNGIELHSRTKMGLGIKFTGGFHVCPGTRGASDQVFIFKVLATFAFSSLRKRSSVVIEMPTGEVILFCKGADDKMWDLMSKKHLDKKEKAMLEKQLTDYSVTGLRTLVFGYKLIPQDEWAPFFARWNSALSLLGDDHDREVGLLMDEMEQNLLLQGATAIEDKLQDGVPWAIDYLCKATIKVWMITGDKQETAENIAKSCKLIAGQTLLRVVNAKDTAHCAQMISDEAVRAGSIERKSLVIDGKSLLYALLDHGDALLELASICETVVVCRADPIQKAGVVTLVKKGTKKVCLAIGDGANDISMLQAAHVGVGIYGKEGTQAARTADFAIHNFQHLPRLLAVHGRYNLLRNSLMFEYSFYKNIALIGPQVWFSVFSFFSAQTFFDDWLMSWYNQLINGLPPIAMSLFEKDLREDVLLKNPQVYRELRDGMYFTWKSFGRWMLSALWGSLIIYFASFLVYPVLESSGLVDDLWSASTIVFVGGIWAMLLRGALAEGYWVWTTFAFFGIAILLTWVLYCIESAIVLFFPRFYGTMNIILATPVCWLLWPVMSVAVVFPDFLWITIQREYFPWEWQILQDQWLKNKKNGTDHSSEPAADPASPTPLKENLHGQRPSEFIEKQPPPDRSTSSSSSSDGSGDIKIRKITRSLKPKTRPRGASYEQETDTKENMLTGHHVYEVENGQPSPTTRKRTLSSIKKKDQIEMVGGGPPVGAGVGGVFDDGDEGGLPPGTSTNGPPGTASSNPKGKRDKSPSKGVLPALSLQKSKGDTTDAGAPSPKKNPEAIRDKTTSKLQSLSRSTKSKKNTLEDNGAPAPTSTAGRKRLSLTLPKNKKAVDPGPDKGMQECLANVTSLSESNVTRTEAQMLDSTLITSEGNGRSGARSSDGSSSSSSSSSSSPSTCDSPNADIKPEDPQKLTRC